MSIGDIRIGISGWRYAGWRGVFYPDGLPQRRELEHASSIFRSIKINGTFFSLQRPDYFSRWAAAVPPGFVFAVKGPRFITHMKQLRDCEVPLANFLASGLLALGPALGPILWQLPPRFRYERPKMGAFFAGLPRSTGAAARLARRHDHRLDGRALVEIDADRPLRHAVEIRHPSFIDADFVDLLRRHGVALVCADTVGWPLLMDATADFVYCRLHGSEELYTSGYDEAALEVWADRVVTWARGGEVRDGPRATPHDLPRRRRRDVYVYFDNDAKVRAPIDAQALMAKVALRLGGREDATGSASAGKGGGATLGGS